MRSLFFAFVFFLSSQTLAQTIIGVFDASQGQIIRNNELAIACNNCFDQNLNAVSFYKRSVQGWDLTDEFVFDEELKDYVISDLSVSEDGTSFCVFIELVGDRTSPPPPDSDLLVCYSKVEGSWKSTLEIDKLDYSAGSYFSKHQVDLSSDGTMLVFSYPDLTQNPSVTQEILTDIYEFSDLNGRYELEHSLEKRIFTNAKFTQKLLPNNEHIILSPFFALGWHENQFIHYSKIDGVWIEEGNTFGIDILGVPPSVIDGNHDFDRLIFPTYTDKVNEHDPCLTMLENDGMHWVQKAEPYKTYKSYTVNSISLSENSKFIGVGYSNSLPGSDVTGPDSLSFIDLLVYENSQFSLLNRFNYDSSLNNSPFGIANIVEISDDASILLVNNGNYQRIVYGIETLTGVEGFMPETEELIEIDAYPNPSNGIVHIDNLIYDKVVIFNSIGQLVFESEYSNQINVSHLENGFYQLLFQIDGMPRYSSKLLKF